MDQDIQLDEHGIAWIGEPNTKVIEIIEDVLAYGWSPEEIHFQHPHLSLAQIHTALSYYYDHQQFFEQRIVDSLVEYDRRRAASMDSPLRQRLATERLNSVEFLPL